MNTACPSLRRYRGRLSEVDCAGEAQLRETELQVEVWDEVLHPHLPPHLSSDVTALLCLHHFLPIFLISKVILQQVHGIRADLVEQLEDFGIRLNPGSVTSGYW